MDGGLSTPLNSSAMPQSTPVNSVADGWMVDLLERAIARVNVREKTAALSMGMDPGQFSRSKHPDGSLALQKVGRLPVDVLDEFAALLADARGLLVRRRDARERRVQRITALQRELLALMDEDVRDRTEVAS